MEARVLRRKGMRTAGIYRWGCPCCMGRGKAKRFTKIRARRAERRAAKKEARL